MTTDYLISNIDGSLDPAARQRQELWLRRRVEDLEATGRLIVNAYTDGDLEAAGLAIRRLAALLGEGE